MLSEAKHLWSFLRRDWSRRGSEILRFAQNDICEIEKMLLLIDNYDSFTYNLAQYFGELGCDVVVKRNDEISLEEIAELAPERICISPGPCTPCESGISKQSHSALCPGNADSGRLPRSFNALPKRTAGTSCAPGGSCTKIMHDYP